MKTALITGGARGIGRAIAENLARDHCVAITYNSTPPKALLCDHPDIFAIKADLSDPDAPTQIIDSMIAKFGQIDVIVNNAGAIEMTPLDAVDAHAEARNLAVNLIAPMGLLSAALPHLPRGAAIVNISSVNAVLPAMGGSGYSASKAALNTWTCGAAKELGPKGIRVNAIAPGLFGTPMVMSLPDNVIANLEASVEAGRCTCPTASGNPRTALRSGTQRNSRIRIRRRADRPHSEGSRCRPRNVLFSLSKQRRRAD